MSLAPIAIFAYNRPWHIRQTIRSLQWNMLARRSDLFIFSDGPRNGKDQDNVDKVRKYIRTVNGFKRITIREREKNYGLAESIVVGVTEIVNKYGKIIVLEDDMILSKGFLKFMNESLRLFETNKNVGMVSGYVFPLVRYPRKPFFLRGGNCWGWGTWKRAWGLFEKNPRTILSKIIADNLSDEFDYQGYAGYIAALKKLEKEPNKTWAILWYGTQFINNLFGYHPNCSLVQNIGFDGTGIHGGITNIYQTKTLSSVKVVDIPVRENELVRKELTNFFRTKLEVRSSIAKRLYVKFRGMSKHYENSTS